MATALLAVAGLGLGIWIGEFCRFGCVSVLYVWVCMCVCVCVCVREFVSAF